MEKAENISIPQRGQVPDTVLYIEIHTKSGNLGGRDIMIMIPGGPGNDHTTYDTPVNSIAQALLPFVDIILFDPRGCGQNEKNDVKYCSLDEYVEDI